MGLIALGAAVGGPAWPSPRCCCTSLGHGLAKSGAVPRRRAASCRPPAAASIDRGARARRPPAGAGRAVRPRPCSPCSGCHPFSTVRQRTGHRPGRVRRTPACTGWATAAALISSWSPSPPHSSGTPAGCCSAPSRSANGPRRSGQTASRASPPLAPRSRCSPGLLAAAALGITPARCRRPARRGGRPSWRERHDRRSSRPPFRCRFPAATAPAATASPPSHRRHAGRARRRPASPGLPAGPGRRRTTDGDTAPRAVYLLPRRRPGPARRAAPRARPGRCRTLPSLAGLSFPAGRFEREMRDLFGIDPVDHPLPRRLVRHCALAPRLVPDAPRRRPATRRSATSTGPFPFRTVEGPGVYEIPVGPVHAGTDRTRPLPVLRGRGDHPQTQGPALVRPQRHRETLRGPRPGSAASSSPNGSAATPPSGTPSPTARPSRTPATCPSPTRPAGSARSCSNWNASTTTSPTSARCATTSRHGILNTHAQRIREQLLRINDDVTGHRLLRGAIRPGAAVLRRAARPRASSPRSPPTSPRSSRSPWTTAWSRDRFTGTAVLTTAAGRRHRARSATSPAPAACAIDARHDHPIARPARFTRHHPDPHRRRRAGPVLHRAPRSSRPPSRTGHRR